MFAVFVVFFLCVFMVVFACHQRKRRSEQTSEPFLAGYKGDSPNLGSRSLSRADSEKKKKKKSRFPAKGVLLKRVTMAGSPWNSPMAPGFAKEWPATRKKKKKKKKKKQKKKKKKKKKRRCIPGVTATHSFGSSGMNPSKMGKHS